MMAAFQYKKAENIIEVVNRLPAGPMFTDVNTGETFEVGGVIPTSIDNSHFQYINSISEKVARFKELVTEALDDDRYNFDFELREAASEDYQFLVNSIVRHGERA